MITHRTEGQSTTDVAANISDGRVHMTTRQVDGAAYSVIILTANDARRLAGELLHAASALDAGSSVSEPQRPVCNVLGCYRIPDPKNRCRTPNCPTWGSR